MPIKGISDVRRFSRGGKLRLGEKRTSSKGKEYPDATDHFIFDPDDEKLIPIFEKLFGDQPKRVQIAFAAEDIERVFPQYYKCYSARGLLCKGDGETAMRRADDSAEMFEIDCPSPSECEFALARKDSGGKPGCRRVASLQFFIPDLPVMQVFQIDTSSLNSIININSQLEILRRVCGRISFIPVTLALKQQSCMLPTGKKGTIYALDLVVGVGLRDLPSIRALTADAYPQLAPPPVSDKLPDDLYSPRSLEDPVEHVEAETGEIAPPTDDREAKQRVYGLCLDIEKSIGMDGHTATRLRALGYTRANPAPIEALDEIHADLTRRFNEAKQIAENAPPPVDDAVPDDAPFDIEPPAQSELPTAAVADTDAPLW